MYLYIYLIYGEEEGEEEGGKAAKAKLELLLLGD